jgi:hypothetical protein
MKYITSLLALAAIATARSIAELPECSKQCIDGALIEIQCSLADYKCSCSKADKLIPFITPCVQKACSALEDQWLVKDVLEGICKDIGFSISVEAWGPAYSTDGMFAFLEDVTIIIVL